MLSALAVVVIVIVLAATTHHLLRCTPLRMWSSSELARSRREWGSVLRSQPQRWARSAACIATRLLLRRRTGPGIMQLDGCNAG
jgi:hypothetical protein